ncbi:MAG: MlaD family protein [Gemmatimonadota bacterium]
MKRLNETMVGVVLVLGVVVAVAGTLFLQGVDWRGNQVELEGLFYEVGLIQPGNPVRVRGVRIGRVAGVDVMPGGEAVRVRVQVDSQVALPQDAGMILAPESMFGDWQAEIVSREQYPSLRFYENPPVGVIPGYSLPDITRLTAAADRIAENLTVLTDRVTMAFTEETALNIARAIDNIEDVSNRLSDLVETQASGFSQVFSQVQGSAEELGMAAAAARRSFQRVDGLVGSGEIDSVLVNARDASRNLSELSRDLTQTNQEFQGMLGRADSAFQSVNRLTARVEAGEGSLGRMLSDSGMVLQVESALAQLQQLLQDVRENPQRYVRLSIF